MIAGLQPSRPKICERVYSCASLVDGLQPPQQSAQTTYVHEQRRAVHEAISSPQPQGLSTTRPRSQIEAMPPHHTALATTPFQPPPHALYNSAIRHPVFFTQNLRKPPFPIPQIASQGWSPVASGYIMEQQRAMNAEPKTKL
jgi:hypothetical protein